MTCGLTANARIERCGRPGAHEMGTDAPAAFAPVTSLGRFLSVARTVPTGLEIARNAFPTFWAAPISANCNRSLRGSREERHGLVITRIIYDAQNRIKKRRLSQAKRPGSERCGGVFISDETVYARFFQNRFSKPDHCR